MTDKNALNNPDRLKALQLSGLMDVLPEDSFDRVTRIAAQILGVPVSLLSLVDEKRQFFKSAYGLPMPMRETPLSHSFCQYVVKANAPMVVEDALRNDLVRENGAVRDLGVRSYMGVPIYAATGETLGSLCAIDVKPRIWEDHDVALLQDLGQMVMAEIRLRHEIALREENEKRLQVLAQEMAHRIKNVFSLTSGLIAISAQDEATRAFAQKIGYRLQSLAHAQEFVNVAQVGLGTQNTLSGLLETLTAAYPAGKIAIPASTLLVGESAATAFALVVHELVTNAVKYGALSVAGGCVAIAITEAGDDVHMTWSEHGGPSLAGEPQATGFGRSMIGRSMKIYLDGGVQYDWKADGLEVKLHLKKARLGA